MKYKQSDSTIMIPIADAVKIRYLLEELSMYIKEVGPRELRGCEEETDRIVAALPEDEVGGWIQHDGRTVHAIGLTLVDIVFNDGEILTCEAHYVCWDTRKRIDGFFITHYRIVGRALNEKS